MQIGAVMGRGELFDESLRVYPFLNGAIFDGQTSGSSESPSSSSSSSSSSGEKGRFGYFSVPVMQDIPSIVLSKAMLRAKTENGVYAMWGKTTVKRASNGKPYFDVGGSEKDVSAFWNDIWENAEKTGTDLGDIIGKEGEEISPAKFFVDNLVGANTLFVVVDKSQIDDTSMMRNPMFFDMLTAVVPSAIRLFLVEHGEVGEDVVVDEDDKVPVEGEVVETTVETAYNIIMYIFCLNY